MPKVNINVNGKELSGDVEERQLLVHFLRDDMDLTGTHVGCDTSQCGACIVHVDGKAIKSCTMLAVQAHEKNVITIEGIADGDKLHPVQEAFRDNHGLQCGFCTPGMIMAAIDIIKRKPNLEQGEVYLHIEALVKSRGTGGEQFEVWTLDRPVPAGIELAEDSSGDVVGVYEHPQDRGLGGNEVQGPADVGRLHGHVRGPVGVLEGSGRNPVPGDLDAVGSVSTRLSGSGLG